MPPAADQRRRGQVHDEMSTVVVAQARAAASPALPPAPLAGFKDDSTNGNSGPSTSGLSSSTEVWPVTRDWDGLDAAPGIAWSASSGLTWRQSSA